MRYIRATAWWLAFSAVTLTIGWITSPPEDMSFIEELFRIAVCSGAALTCLVLVTLAIWASKVTK